MTRFKIIAIQNTGMLLKQSETTFNSELKEKSHQCL